MDELCLALYVKFCHDFNNLFFYLFIILYHLLKNVFNGFKCPFTLIGIVYVEYI